MRVFLTKGDLESETGLQLLGLAVRITSDGKLDQPEIVELLRWLRNNQSNSSINAIAYLRDIMARIVADGVVSRDELIELHLAIERVIPAEQRAEAVDLRRKRESTKRKQETQAKQAQKEQDRKVRKREREAEAARRNRLRHCFAKVAGISFPNEDGSERQEIARRCEPGEQLILQQDADNPYSETAVRILRANGEQLGHAPEYLGERIAEEIEDGKQVVGVLVDVTGGFPWNPTRGVNFAVFFIGKDVTQPEFQQYVRDTLAARN